MSGGAAQLHYVEVPVVLKSRPHAEAIDCYGLHRCNGNCLYYGWRVGREKFKKFNFCEKLNF